MVAGGLRKFLTAAAGAAAGLYTLGVSVSGRPVWLLWTLDIIPIVVPAVAAVVCARAAARSRGQARTAWWLFAAGAASWAAGDIVFTILEAIGQDAVTLFTLADVGYLALIPAWCAALVVLQPAERRRGLQLLGSWIDAIVVLLIAGTVTAATVLLPLVRTEENVAGLVVNLAYPVGDLALIAAFVALVARSEKRLRSSQALIGAAVVVFAVGDTFYAYLSLTDSYEVGSPVDLTWVAAFVVLAVAAARGLTIDKDRRLPASPLVARAIIGFLAITGFIAAAFVGVDRTLLLPAAAIVGLLFFLRTLLRVAENRDLVDRLEGALHQAEDALAARDEFVVAASHQLKTPLASLLLRIDLLADDETLDARQREYVSEMRDQVTRLTRLTRTLLAVMSRKSSLPAESISVSRTLREVVDSVAPLALARGVDLQAERFPEDDMIVAPEGALEEVALNLISNAVKYSPRGGHVCVSVDRNADMLRLCVTDEGGGIGPAAIAHVFESGYRGPGVSDSQTGFGPGFGVGLSIAKRICDAVGATISLEPRSTGTTAEVVWPVSIGTAEVFTEEEEPV
jgi:signal transduction histidine kinase